MNITRGLPELKDEVDGTNKRWDDLNADLEERDKDLENALNKVGEIEEKLKPIEAVVDEVKGLVKEPVLVGANVDDGKKAKDQVQVCVLNTSIKNHNSMPIVVDLTYHRAVNMFIVICINKKFYVFENTQNKLYRRFLAL